MDHFDLIFKMYTLMIFLMALALPTAMLIGIAGLLVKLFRKSFLKNPR